MTINYSFLQLNVSILFLTDIIAHPQHDSELQIKKESKKTNKQTNKQLNSSSLKTFRDNLSIKDEKDI